MPAHFRRLTLMQPTMPSVDRFRIQGGTALEGQVRITGAKNSVLKLMAAALLAQGTTTLHEVPGILDVSIMAELLRRLGCEVAHDEQAGTVTMQVPQRPGHQADYDLVRRMRASICVLGPLVARLGEADVALPGGDNIGNRGLDMHVGGLQKLGASVVHEHGFIKASAPDGLVGAQIWLDFPSVGATENILTAAVLAHGTTVIDNAAREPEIVDLCTMLSSMGAKIDGAGTSTLEIQGVDALNPVTHTTVSDRIIAGTFAFAAAMTQGDVTVLNSNPVHLEITLDKLVTAGANVITVENGFRVQASQRLSAVDVVTLPWPGFATDLMPFVVAFNAVACGTAMVTENVFESRFMFVQELARLGADIRTDGHHAVIRGRQRLSGAPVQAHDIRAGAGLILAGLCAEGVTTVSDAYHVDRGYPGFTEQLCALGASVGREPDPDAEILVG